VLLLNQWGKKRVRMLHMKDRRRNVSHVAGAGDAAEHLPTWEAGTIRWASAGWLLAQTSAIEYLLCRTGTGSDTSRMDTLKDQLWFLHKFEN